MNRNMTFETAMKRLEEVVGRLEGGEEPLEASLKLFEEGSALAALCYGKLQKAEQKIKQITDVEEAAAEKEQGE